MYRSWTTEADLSQRLAAARHLREQLASVVSIRAGSDPELARLDEAADDAWRVAPPHESSSKCAGMSQRRVTT